MAIQYINTGSSANAGNGDSLRSAFVKVNNNFAYLSTSSGGAGNGYTGSQGDIGYTGSAGSQGNIGYTGSAGISNVNIEISPESEVNSLAFYQTTSTISRVPRIKADGGVLFIGDKNSPGFLSGLYIENSLSAEGFGRGFTYANHLEVAEANNFTFYRSRGTPLVPTATVSGDEIVDINFLGHNGTTATYGFNITASIDQVPVGGQQPMRLTFAGNNNAGQILPHLIITSTGTVRMNKLGAIGNSTSISILSSLIPSVNAGYDLGSTSSQWRSLYVSSSTIYIDRKALSIDENNNITINGEITAGGYTGSQGDRGYTGSRGNAGIAGESGATGFTGSRGNLGYTGSRGDTGYDGSRGDIGYAGSRGDLGYTGSRGDTGYDGSRGDIGYTGSEGTPGQQGNRGYTGSEGAQGTPGLQGNTGAQGVSIVLVGSTDTVTTSTVGLGTAGQGWINTTDGDVYFWNTLTTNWENIGPIVGPQGDLGYTGSQGTQGDIGLTGDLGYTGSQGDKGYDGSRGDVGYAGSQGELGYVGSQGDLGYVGSQGDIGYTGSQGELGYVGSQGDIGYVGSAGPQGDPGPDLYTPTTSTDWNGSPTVATFTAGLDELASRTVTLEDNKDRITTGSYSVVLGSDGVLTLPGGNTRIGDVYGAGNDVIAGSTGTAVGVLTQGTGGYAALQWIGDTTTSTTNAAAVIVNSPFSASSGTVQIATGAVNGPVTDNIWEFGANGILTLPNGLTIDGSGTVGNSIQIGGTSTWISVDNEGAPPGFMVATDVGGADHRWLFDPDGTLTAPGHLMPNADLAYDLGSTTTQWRSIYVGTGTIYIGGVALGVNQDNYVTVDGNPIITVNTAGNFTVQGDTNIVLGAVVISDTAPAATTPGSQWFNTVEARTYVAYNEQWVDSSPTVLAPPDTNPTLESVTFNDNTTQTTAWSGTYSYNDLTDKPVAPAFVGGGGANTWLTAE